MCAKKFCLLLIILISSMCLNRSAPPWATLSPMPFLWPPLPHNQHKRRTHAPTIDNSWLATCSQTIHSYSHMDLAPLGRWFVPIECVSTDSWTHRFTWYVFLTYLHLPWLYGCRMATTWGICSFLSSPQFFLVPFMLLIADWQVHWRINLSNKVSVPFLWYWILNFFASFRSKFNESQKSEHAPASAGATRP